MFFSRWLVVALSVAACLSSPAHAKWHMASSEHFVIYADDSPKDLAKFGEMLEKYHSAVSHIIGKRIDSPSPSSRVTIYVVGSERALQELHGSGSKVIQGYFQARAGASSAFVQDLRSASRKPDGSTLILLHEYAHYFIASTNRFALPRWLSEGMAEFFSSASFEKDGRVTIGRPAFHRANELFDASDVPIRELFDPRLYATREDKHYSQFYGRSWLLYHYLIFNSGRKGQLANYWSQTIRGAEPIDAAEGAFGNLDQLDKELDTYLKSKSWTFYDIQPETISIGPVNVRALSQGMAAMMPVVIKSKNGVDSETAPIVLEEARKIASEYPNDPGVLAALAEAEFDAGNNREAIIAADRAIAADPSEANAYVQKIYAEFALADEAEDIVAAYQQALVPVQALKRIEKDHPIALIHNYRNFIERGQVPPKEAKEDMERALKLAPFDQSLAFNVGLMLAADGRIREAIRTLEPLAANPHDRKFAASAQQMINRLWQASEGQPLYPSFGGPMEAEGEESE